jgi:pimeloyl-ACP methyl ester carboxylesterase
MSTRQIAIRCTLLVGSLAIAATLPALAQQAPCCSITAIDSQIGTAKGKVNAAELSFEFRVNDSKLAATLKVGQHVYANFKTKQVSLDGKTVCCEIIPANGPASSPAAAAQAINRARIGERVQAGKCQQWMPQYGGVICGGTDQSKPAILLVHGLHQSAESWTKPSSTGYNFDHMHTPAEANLGNHSLPNTGLYKAGSSGMLDVDALNWFEYLVQQGFTVAAWSQPCCNFAAAYPSAQQVLAQFASDTAAMNPSAPPEIALVGHSRGGLVIHKLLRDQGSLGGRIRWAITIHSPHHGSRVAETPQVLADNASQLFAGVELPSEVKNPLRDLALHIVSPLNQLIDDGSKELAPQSSLIRGLLNGDAQVAGVRYYTFGGTSPTLVRLYTWLFTPMSSVPQYRNLEQYFDWQAKPAEVGLVSPLLERVPAVVPEIKAGEGDSLVTDQSARLPYSIHETDQLNHAEVLWDRTLQQKVAVILSGGSPRILAPKPLSPR